MSLPCLSEIEAMTELLIHPPRERLALHFLCSMQALNTAARYYGMARQDLII